MSFAGKPLILVLFFLFILIRVKHLGFSDT